MGAPPLGPANDITDFCPRLPYSLLNILIVTTNKAGDGHIATTVTFGKYQICEKPNGNVVATFPSGDLFPGMHLCLAKLLLQHIFGCAQNIKDISL